MNKTTAVSDRSLMVREKVVFDGGNRTSLWIAPDKSPRCIPSYIKEVDTDFEDVPSPGKGTIVIQKAGRVYVLGELAKQAGGKPVFEVGKVGLAPDLVLAALEPNQGSNTVIVEQLLLALPNARNDADTTIFKGIEGTHEFIRNGQHVVATVRKVVPVDETRAAYQYAVNRSLWAHPDRVNGVIDLGGGTAIGRLYDANGNILRRGDLVLDGTAALAGSIAAMIAKNFDTRPPLDSIMDGIERGDYSVGIGGFCFKAAYEKAHKKWLDGIQEQVKLAWREWFSSLAISEVLIVGGSAPLAQRFVTDSKGRFKVAENPQTISILGMGML